MQTHPSLYNHINSNKAVKLKSSDSTIPKKRDKVVTKAEDFDALLDKYKTIPKAAKPNLKRDKRIGLRHLPQIAQHYIPIPKSYKPTRSTVHPMLLRRRYLHQNKLSNPKSTAAKYILAQHVMDKMNHVFDEKGKKKTLDRLLIDDISTWGKSLSNELGRLSQGIRNITGNNAMTFIKKNEVPLGKKVAYANMVCDHRPLKTEKYRVRLTVGGDVLEYNKDSSSPAASLLEAKLLLNSVISDAFQGARFMTIDIKDFFLQSFLEEPECLRIHKKYFFPDICEKYNINSLIAPDNYVYCKIIRGVYGLKQAAKLARDKLVDHLKPYGYYPDKYAQNIWKHKTRPTKFCLCVDDFGIKYNTEEDAEHLINALKTAYEITIDKEGTDFCGLKLHWNYQNGYVDINMPGYVQKALKKLEHNPPTIPQHAPHKWVPITYGKQIHQTEVDDTTPHLSSLETRHIQKIVGTFLYYARAVDNTIHPALNEIASTQAKPTVQTKIATNMLMDYLHTNPNATLRYTKSDMQLHVDSDAAYLVAPQAKSRAAGYFYLSKRPSSTTTAPTPPLNAPIHIECTLLKHVVSSAAEAETGALFHNCKTAIELKHMLEALGHKQRTIPIKIDNSTASSFANATLKHKRSKTWNMRWYWLKDKVRQKELYIYWQQGSKNYADYHSKHFPPSYHTKVRPKYILKGYNISTKCTDLRGCVYTPPKGLSK